MNPDELRDYLMSKPAVTEETPFGPEVLVYKVKGKMFATLGFEVDEGIETGRSNLKCDRTRVNGVESSVLQSEFKVYTRESS